MGWNPACVIDSLPRDPWHWQLHIYPDLLLSEATKSLNSSSAFWSNKHISLWLDGGRAAVILVSVAGHPLHPPGPGLLQSARVPRSHPRQSSQQHRGAGASALLGERPSLEAQDLLCFPRWDAPFPHWPLPCQVLSSIFPRSQSHYFA